MSAKRLKKYVFKTVYIHKSIPFIPHNPLIMKTYIERYYLWIRTDCILLLLLSLYITLSVLCIEDMQDYLCINACLLSLETETYDFVRPRNLV